MKEELANLVAELEELEKKATPGPWSLCPDHESRDHDHIMSPHTDDDGFAMFDVGEEGDGTDGNAALVVALRNAWPKLREALREKHVADSTSTVDASSQDSGPVERRQGPWRCFWCNAEFHDCAKAEAHFGAPHMGRDAPECLRLAQREARHYCHLNVQLSERLVALVYAYDAFAKHDGGAAGPIPSYQQHLIDQVEAARAFLGGPKKP